MVEDIHETDEGVVVLATHTVSDELGQVQRQRAVGAEKT
jgi:hypothetical protein